MGSYLYHNLVLEFIQEGEIELPREIAKHEFFVLLQPFPCREIVIIDLFLVALLSLVCLVLTDSSSLVTRLTEECHRSDGERSLEWQTPAVAYPFGSLHDLCVAVVVVLLDEVVRHFQQDLSILLIICQINSLGHLFDRSDCSLGRNNR